MFDFGLGFRCLCGCVRQRSRQPSENPYLSAQRQNPRIRSGRAWKDSDDDILPLVNELQLGKFSIHGQEIRIDRKTILSRLASMGIKSSWVTFNGAERISVCRDESTITTDRFVDAARDYL
ncbi:MAG: hypothetical protein ACYSSK_09225, partial [Planctomycetota bacterium]